MRPASVAGVLVLGLMLALASVLPAAPAGAALPDAEARMLGHLNSARAAQGLGSLSTHGDLTRIARSWAARMASDYEAGGSRQGALRHNPSFRDQVPSDHRRAGENVGYSVLTDASHAALVDRLHRSYMDSPGHRANILGEFDRVGIGLVTAEDGTMWSAVVFMLGPSSSSSKPAAEESQTSDAGSSSGASGQSGSGSSSSESGASTESGSGDDSEPDPDPEPAPDPEPDPEPVPDPPTAQELFGDGWPDGYLVGDPEVARDLLAGIGDLRRVARLWPGSRAPETPRLLGAQPSGL